MHHSLKSIKLWAQGLGSRVSGKVDEGLWLGPRGSMLGFTLA